MTRVAHVPVIAERDEVRLAGSVWLPEERARGLVLMHPGSGPSDRHNDVLFPPIRAALLSLGSAVCSFDKRGVGGSTGHWTDAGIEAQAEDLAAGLQAARAVVPDVPIGLFGHSQGGWVVIEASRHVAPSFVVTNSGPSVTPLVQETYSTGNQLRDQGWSADAVAAGVRTFQELMALAGNPFGVVSAWLGDGSRAELVAALVDADVFVPDSAALWTLSCELFRYDPLPALEELSVALLALFGAQDRVVPVSECIPRFAAVDLLELVVVDGGDHRMHLAGSDEFAPGYLAALTRFVDAQLRTVGA